MANQERFGLNWSQNDYRIYDRWVFNCYTYSERARLYVG